MIFGGLVRQGEISFTIILSLHIHSMRYIKEWTAKKNPDPGDIPVIQSSTFQCSVWGGGQKKSHRATETGKNTEQYLGWRGTPWLAHADAQAALGASGHHCGA